MVRFFFFFFFCPTLLDFHLRILNIKWIYIYTLKAEFFSPFFFCCVSLFHVDRRLMSDHDTSNDHTLTLTLVYIFKYHNNAMSISISIILMPTPNVSDPSTLLCHHSWQARYPILQVVSRKDPLKNTVPTLQ